MAERSGCATAFLWIVGLVLLVPGLCTLFALNDGKPNA
jgi:hypothetical protein